MICLLYVMTVPVWCSHLLKEHNIYSGLSFIVICLFFSSYFTPFFFLFSCFFFYFFSIIFTFYLFVFIFLLYLLFFFLYFINTKTVYYCWYQSYSLISAVCVLFCYFSPIHLSFSFKYIL